MTPEATGKAYDQITHRWQKPHFNFQNGIEQHKLALNFLNQKDKALDVGCGCTGRFIDLLQNEGFEAHGLDVSKNMIELAKQKHPESTFFHEDICEWEAQDKYDFITAWDSIWHVPLEQQSQVLTQLVSYLNPNGILIFSFGGTDEPGEHTNSIMGPEVYYSSLGTNGYLKRLIDLGCTPKHLHFDQHPELHAYLVVQKLS